VKIEGGEIEREETERERERKLKTKRENKKTSKTNVFQFKFIFMAHQLIFLEFSRHRTSLRFERDRRRASSSSTAASLWPPRRNPSPPFAFAFTAVVEVERCWRCSLR